MIDEFSIEQCMKDIDHMLEAFDQIENTQMRKKLKPFHAAIGAPTRLGSDPPAGQKPGRS